MGDRCLVSVVIMQMDQALMRIDALPKLAQFFTWLVASEERRSLRASMLALQVRGVSIDTSGLQQERLLTTISRE
jgi:hypothetical protein